MKNEPLLYTVFDYNMIDMNLLQTKSKCCKKFKKKAKGYCENCPKL